MSEMSPNRPQAGQKTALVTGAGVGGIGGALATELQRAGYFVFCAVRKPVAIEALIETNMRALELDVSSSDSISAAAETVANLTGGHLDLLINNAGSATHRPALDLDVDGVVHDMFDVNVLGPMRMVKLFSKLLIASKGCVVNIGSVAPIAPLVYSSAYNATKAALHAYGDGISMELKPFGVSVVTVITGAVKSNIVRESNPSLPSTSLYRPVEKFWLQRVTQSQSETSGTMNTEQYARQVVAMIKSKSKPHWLWAGGSALIVRILYYLLPRRLRLAIMAQRFGLNSLRG